MMRRAVRNHLAAVLAAFLWSAPAAGQQLPPGCMPQDDVREAFWQKYNERPVARGVLDNGWLFEVFANTDGDFSVFVTSPVNISCIVASGGDLEEIVSGLRPEGRGL